MARVTPVFFATPAELRRWFAANHRNATEVWLGFHKKRSGKPSITYREALDEALAVGWIDGVRKRLNDTSYVQRFTPRRPRSYWSAVNVARVGALQKAGRMKAAGLKAFNARDQARTARYSYERQNCAFGPHLEREFRKEPAAWTFFQAQPPGYRRLMTWFVMGAKQEATRLKRLRRLIAASAAEQRIT